MDDWLLFILFLGFCLVGFIATVAYWYGRYYFNTDQEKSELGKDKNEP